MVEVLLEGLAPNVEEGTIQSWFFEEGDPVNEGDDLLEVTTPEGVIVIQAKASGILAEVYYDEGDTVPKGEVLCAIDGDDEAISTKEEDDEDDEAEKKDEEDEDDDEIEDDDEDEEEEEVEEI